MPGPLPKPRAQRQRTNRSATAATFEAPQATKVPLEGERWHSMTLGWWDVIWRSPMAKEEWIDADVPALLILADLVNRYWIDGDPKLAAEIRMQCREFGLTPMSRRSLQWEIKRLTEPAKPAPVPGRTVRQRAGTLAVLEGGKTAARR